MNLLNLIEDTNTGYDNLRRLMDFEMDKKKQPVMLTLGGEQVKLDSNEAHFMFRKYEVFNNAGRQKEFIDVLGDPVKFDQHMKQLRNLIAKQENFRGSVEGGRDVDEGRTQMYSDGDRVKLNSTYANSDNPNEIYTVAQCDQDRKRCWIGDKSGSGWYVTFDQIIPAISRDAEGQGRPYWSRIHDSSLKETSTIDGKTEDPGALRWKQTSMSYEAAVNKYGADHVRKEGKNRAGQEVIAVHVPLGEQAVSLGNNDEYNDESGMAYNSLRTIHRATKGLANTIKDGDNLPEWCQKKISLAEDYLVTVWDYLQSEKGMAEGLGTSPDRLLARTGMNNAHKFPRDGQTNLGNIPGMNTPDASPETKAYADQQRAKRPGDLKAAIRGQLGKHHKPNLPEQDVEEGLTQILRKFDPTIKARIRGKSQDQTNQGLEMIRANSAAGFDPADTADMHTREMQPNTYFKRAERYAKLANKDVSEGLGYSRDPAQAKWYHKGRMAFEGGTTGNLIQDIAKKHGCPPEWFEAFLAGYQDQEGFSKDGVAEGETTLTKTGRIHRSTDAYGGSPPEPDPVGDELDKSGTSRIDRALGVRFKAKGYQKATNTVSEGPGDKGSSREHLAMLQAEREQRKQNQRAKQEKMDRDLENYQAGRVRANYRPGGVDEAQARMRTTKHGVAAGGSITNKAIELAIRKLDNYESREDILALVQKDPELYRELKTHLDLASRELNKRESAVRKSMMQPSDENLRKIDHLQSMAGQYEENAAEHRFFARKLLSSYLNRNEQGMAEASKTRTPTRDFLRKHPVPDSEMVKPVKNKDANASLKNMMGGSSNELTKNLKIKEQESTPGDEHTRRQKLIKDLAKHKGWDHSDLEHATTPELIQYYKECRRGMAEGSTESPQQKQVRAAITKGIEVKSQYGKDEYQSQPTKRNWFDPKGFSSDQLTGVDSIDPDGTVVISLGDTSAEGMVKKLATLGGMPGVKTRQIQAKVMGQGLAEARSVDDLKNELTSWKKEGPWKKTTTKDPRGKAPNLSDRARRETEKSFPTTKKV